MKQLLITDATKEGCLIEFIIKVLKDDLEKMDIVTKETGSEPIAHSGGATEECKKVSNGLIAQLEAGNYEIDSFQLGYLDTVLFNYYPKDIIESQKLINSCGQVAGLFTNPVYPVKSQKELEKGFEWAKEEKKAIGIHVKMPKFEKPEIIINPYENLGEKATYYQRAYNEDLELHSCTDIRIVGYEIIKNNIKTC